jgi:glycosyltransferase involved in cell wall biosynthesis
MSNRVLLVVYLFPPRGGVGVMRGLSFARYLPKSDCRLWVVTARNASNAYVDPTLVAQIPSEVEVHRTFTPELPYAWRNWLWKKLRRDGAPAKAVNGTVNGTAGLNGSGGGNPLARFVRSLATPDPQRVWLPWALRRAGRLIRRHGIDTVVISVPPFSELALAVALKRRFPSLRIVTDFRDEWLDFTLSSIETPGAAQKRQAAAKLEREAIEASDLVLTVTASWVERMRRRYPDQPAGKFRCLPNGYDDELFQRFRPRPHGAGKLVLTYVGTVYSRAVYSPEAFLRALDTLEPEVLDDLEVRFVGRVERESEALLRGRPYRIVQYGFLPQEQAFQLLEETDVQLLFANDPAWQPAKLFEYVASRKPILAVAPPEGEAAGIIRETGTGRTVAPDDPEALRAAVRELVRLHRDGKGWELKRDERAIASYSRSALAAQLAGFLQE